MVLFHVDPEPQHGDLPAMLSATERARAARFLHADHRWSFIVAHARKRELLGAELGCPGTSLQFDTGPHGKPHLAGEGASSGLQFNLSHSGEWGLLGWCHGHAIGVDVEVWRPLRDEPALVRRYFSARENADYEALPAGGRTEGFFHCWTRKEAYVKAVGRGLGLPLDSFDVSMERGEGARILRQSPDAGHGGTWSLAAPDLTPQPLSLAVVVGADRCHIQPLV